MTGPGPIRRTLVGIMTVLFSGAWALAQTPQAPLKMPVPRNAPSPASIAWESIAPGASHTRAVVNMNGRAIHLQGWTFEPETWRLRVLPAPEDAGLSAYEALTASGAVLAINGGYFDYVYTDGKRRLRPTGLVIARKKTVHRRGGGSGIVYDKRGRVGISWSRATQAWRGADDALQAGPLLVDPGGRHGIRRDSGRLARRSVLCLLHDGRFVILVSRSSVTLFDLATILVRARPYGIGCERAINLDGGPSTQVATNFGGEIGGVAGLSRVVNAILVVPR